VLVPSFILERSQQINALARHGLSVEATSDAYLSSLREAISPKLANSIGYETPFVTGYWITVGAGLAS
jgi:hypothetical protein